MSINSRISGRKVKETAQANHETSVEMGIVALGTTNVTATKLTAGYNEVATCVTGVTDGVMLPVPNKVGFRIYVDNNGAGTLKIYPQVGGNIDGTGVDTAITVATTVKSGWYIATTLLLWESE